MFTSMSSCMSRRRACAIKYRQCGAALLEMAVVMPLLAILVFGVVEFGRALLQINTLTKAVTAGARYVARVPDAVDPSNCSQDTNWPAAIAQGELLIENDNAGAGSVILVGIDVAGAITFSVSSIPFSVGGTTYSACVINVLAEAPFAAMSGNSLVPFFQVGPITLRAQAEERYIGE